MLAFCVKYSRYLWWYTITATSATSKIIFSFILPSSTLHIDLQKLRIYSTVLPYFQFVRTSKAHLNHFFLYRKHFDWHALDANEFSGSANKATASHWPNAILCWDKSKILVYEKRLLYIFKKHIHTFSSSGFHFKFQNKCHDVNNHAVGAVENEGKFTELIEKSYLIKIGGMNGIHQFH